MDGGREGGVGYLRVRVSLGLFSHRVTVTGLRLHSYRATVTRSYRVTVTVTCYGYGYRVMVTGLC